MNINKLAYEIHEQNKAVGWWDNPNRCVFETLQLVSTEIAEATEGERKNLMDDHLKHRRQGEVELADALIRTLDIAGHYNWAYIAFINPHYLLKQDLTIGGQHLACNMALCDLGAEINKGVDLDDAISGTYSQLVNTILAVAEINNYSIMGALAEKMEYNKTRADHKRENRAKANGKKF